MSRETSQDVGKFVAALFEPDDLVEVRLLPGKVQDYVAAESLVDHVPKWIEQNNAGQHIYFGANPRKQRGGTTKDVALVRCLFVDIDNIDVEEAIERLEKSGMPRPTVIVRSGHGLHIYWRLTKPITDFERFRRAQKYLIGQMDSDPSIHDAPRIMRLPGFMNHKPPRKPCELLYAGDERFAFDELIPQDSTHAASLSCSNQPTNEDRDRQKASWLKQALQRAVKGKRNDTGFWLARQLRDAGLTQDEAGEVLEDYADKQTEDYTREEAAASVVSAYSRPPREPAARGAVGDGENDPSILPISDSEVLPEIPPDVLPSWAAQHVAELSKAKEVSPTLATMLTLGAIASTCQRIYEVKIEGSYSEPLCLYVAAALDSGERKTAIHSPIMKPIFQTQADRRKADQKKAVEANAKRRVAEKQVKSLERQIPEVEMTGDTAELERIKQRIMTLELENPKPPGPPQLVMEDFTDAALGVALAENGESLLVTSDEGGLFDNLAGRFNDLPEIDLFLKSHTGRPYTVNRTGRDNIYLNRPLLSVAVSPQPGVLVKLGSKPGFAERGLLARFLWALPASSVGRRALEAAVIDYKITHTYVGHLGTMANRGYAREGIDPKSLTLARDAYTHWKQFERSLEPRMGKSGDLQGIKPWASKLAGAVARIAAVCHVADYVGVSPTEAEISAVQMERAVALGHLLIPHALAAHRLMLGGGQTAAARVVQHFDAEGWPRTVLSQSDWWRPVRRHVGESSADFLPVVQTLLDHGYLIEADRPGGYQTGRPGRYYRANRQLWADPQEGG